MKPPYVLVIDKDRDTVLTFVFNHLMHHDLGGLMMAFKEEGLEQAWLGLIKEKSEKNHANDWCEDPECEDKKR